MAREYAIARRKAAAQTGLRAAASPVECRYGVAQIPDLDYLPGPAEEPAEE